LGSTLAELDVNIAGVQKTRVEDKKGAWARSRLEGTAGTSEVAGVVVVSETACTFDDVPWT